MTTLASLLVIGLAVLAILRRMEPRLTLALAALALGTLAGKPMLIVRTFLDFFTREQFLLPIGCSMGFAYVLQHTGCDRHLVWLLLRPLQRVRGLLVPGVVLLGAMVNVPLISQASTTVAVGAVLVPVLQAARISPATSGAALALGASIGGEMLNPGAPELRTISDATGSNSIQCVRRTWRLLLVHLAVTVPLFWLFCRRADRAAGPMRPAEPEQSDEVEAMAPIRVNYFKALVPVVPLVLLFLTDLPDPLRVLYVPREWLVGVEGKGSFDSRLIATAMLIGVVAAALTDLQRVSGVARSFFEGAGYAVANIVSVIVVANCFGKGVEESGLVAHLHKAIGAVPALLLPAAAGLPMSFAWLCGSGMAATQSLYGFFVKPANTAGVDPLMVGAVVSLSAAAGRTLSPVAPVVLLSASLTGAEPLAMIRRTALPVAAGVLALVVAAWVMG